MNNDDLTAIDNIGHVLSFTEFTLCVIAASWRTFHMLRTARDNTSRDQNEPMSPRKQAMSLIDPDQPPGQNDEREHDHATHESIRERAYYLWQAAGSPADRDGEFWEQAEEAIKHPPEPPAESKASTKTAPSARS